MRFISDIFDKTNKVLSEMGAPYDEFPENQQVKERLAILKQSARYFTCNLYCDLRWLDANASVKNTMLDYFNPEECTATADYLHFLITGTGTGNDACENAPSRVAFIMATQSLLQQTNTLFQLKFDSANYQFYILINFDLLDADLKKLKYNYSGKAVIIDGTQLTKDALLSFIETNLISKETMADLQTLESMKQIKIWLQRLYKAVLNDKKEIEWLQAKKEAIRLETYSINNDKEWFERLQNQKIDIQRSVRDLDWQIKNKYAQLLLPNGYLSNFIDKMCGKLQSVETRDSPDNRFPRMITSVDPNYISSFEKSSSEYMKGEFAKDLDLIQKKTSLLSDAIMSKDQTATAALRTEALPQPDKDKIIACYTKLPRDYEGELPKSNLQGHLMHIRQQTFFIFIIIALLSPLFQLPMFFMKDYEKVNTIRNIINMVVGFISIGFTIYFIIDLKKKMPAVKRELMSKELERIRKELRIDGTRIFADAIREWQSQINNWFSKYMDHMTVSMDGFSNTGGQQRKEKLAELDNQSNTVTAELNEKARIYSETERTVLALIIEYTNAITMYENRVNNAVVRFNTLADRAFK